MLSAGAPRRILGLLAVIGALGLLSAMPASAEPPVATPGLAPSAAPATPAVPAATDEPAPSGQAAPVAERSAAATDEPVVRRAPAKKRRGGINPCMTPDAGFGIYESWSGGLTIGQVLLPHKGGVTKAGGFDLIVHFHGHEPIRKEFVKAAKGIVLVGIDLGIGSGVYQGTFANPEAFPALIASVEAAVAKHAGVAHARVRKLAISSWSAGYGAVEQILRQPIAKKVDAVILLDSLHSGYVDEQQKTLKTAQLEPFLAYARRAASRGTFMYTSHSSILPPGYASTSETNQYLVEKLGGRVKKTSRKDVLGLDMFERFDKGNFHMRGYTGEDKPDHCAHIGLMRDIVKTYLIGRWNTPRGRL